MLLLIPSHDSFSSIGLPAVIMVCWAVAKGFLTSTVEESAVGHSTGVSTCHDPVPQTHLSCASLPIPVGLALHLDQGICHRLDLPRTDLWSIAHQFVLFDSHYVGELRKTKNSKKIQFNFPPSSLQVLITKLRSANTVETRQYHKAAKALLVLIPLLGISYLVFLYAPSEGFFTHVFAYCRATLISTQVRHGRGKAQIPISCSLSVPRDSLCPCSTASSTRRSVLR